MRKLQDPIFTAINADTSKNGDSITTDQTVACSVQVITTGTGINGTLKIQASNDNINFVDIPSATVTLNSASTFLIPVITLCYAHIRLVYTNSGTPTGTITAILQTQGI